MIALVSIVITGCGGAVSSSLRDASSTGQPPARLVVTYDDYHPNWGGERLTLRGDGHMTAVTWRPGAREGEGDVQELQVTPEAVTRVIDLLVEIEAWRQEVEDDEGRLDDARARVRIEVGGDRSTAWEWQNDLQAQGRLVRVKEMLEGLVRQAAPANAAPAAPAPEPEVPSSASETPPET